MWYPYQWHGVIFARANFKSTAWCESFPHAKFPRLQYLVNIFENTKIWDTTFLILQLFWTKCNHTSCILCSYCAEMGGYNDRVGSDGGSRSESTRNLITSLLVTLTSGISRRIWRPFIYRAFRLELVSENWILTQSRSRQHYCVVSNAYSSQDLAESLWPQARRVLRRWEEKFCHY